MSHSGYAEHAGTWRLVLATVRRDRLRIVMWTVGIVAMVVVSAQSVKSLFPTQADLDNAAASSDNPAIIAFQGPSYGLDTVGGQVAFQIGAPGLVLMGLMALLMTGRLTRDEEEAGRLELIRSLPVGRHAPTYAAGTVVGGMCVVIGAAISLVLIALDLPVVGSISYGLGYVLLGLVFVGVTAVTAQVTDNHRLANGYAGVVLGAAFVLRAIGDVRGGWLSFLSPMGWVQQARPYADERWWPLLIALAAAIALPVVAVNLQSRRDLGAGLVAQRPGPAQGAPSLATPLALARRLQIGSVLGWTGGTAFIALVYGAVASAIESFVQDNPQLADYFIQSGGSLIEAYIATSAKVVALLGSGFAIQSILRLRSEETNDRAEPVLATPTSRLRYWSSHLSVAVVGSVVVLVVSGVVLGVSAAIAVGDSALVRQSIVSIVLFLPALLVMIGVGCLLVGSVPMLSQVTWATLVVAFVITMFGAVLDLPGWVMRLSPFESVPAYPAESLSALPIIVLSAIGVGAVVVGAAGYRHRDIPI